MADGCWLLLLADRADSADTDSAEDSADSATATATATAKSTATATVTTAMTTHHHQSSVSDISNDEQYNIITPLSS